MQGVAVPTSVQTVVQQWTKGEKMTLSDVMIIVGFVVVVIATLVGSWYLADWIVPQSDIDKIEAIGRWAKEELERREAERRENT